MPLADRPIVSRRLHTADLENPYFRAWALKGLEDASTRERSQGGSSESTPTTLSISPFTQEPEHGTRSIDRTKFFSESNLSYTSSYPRTPPFSRESDYFPPTTTYEESMPPEKRASIATLSLEEGPIRPSVSSKARKILGLPSIRTPSEAPKEAFPPRKARHGLRWARTNSGNWHETLVEKKRSVTTSQANSEGTTPLVRAVTAEYFMDDDDDTNSLLVIEPPASEPLIKDDSSSQISLEPKFYSSSSDPFFLSDHPKEGVYCRTKRALGLKKDPIIGHKIVAPMPGRTMTGETGSLLDKTSEVLRFVASRGRESTISSTNTSTLSIASPRSATRWQYLRPGLASSVRSSSSSLRSLMRGKPPPPSPEPQSMYTGSDKNQYFSVELTDADAPTFLPSEARRVMTPPVGASSASDTIKFRGFIRERDLPRSAESTYSISSRSTFGTPPVLSSKGSGATSNTSPLMQRSDGEARKNSVNVPGQSPGAEWYHVQMHTIDGYGGTANDHFVLSVPEHLPNSPMCPKHPKNKSGGKGVCVYHGRNVA